MSDNDNIYEKRWEERERATEHYERERERREQIKEAQREAENRRRKPYSYTDIKYEKTLFAKVMVKIGWVLTISSLIALYFFPDFFEQSEYGHLPFGIGVTMILLPWLGRWIGNVLSLFLFIDLFFLQGEESNLTILNYVVYILGIIFGLSVHSLLWKEKSRDKYTVR